MLVKKLALMLGLAVAGPGTVFADGHTITYGAKASTFGQTITLAGQDFVIVRIPFSTFTGEKFYIQAPAPVDALLGGSLSVQTTHETKALTPNININNVPARVAVTDSRTYTVSGDIGTDAQFTTTAGATVAISFKKGSTLVTLFASVGKPPGFTSFETQKDVNASTNLVPSASFATWTDPLQQVKAINDYIDYIRIVAIP